MVFTTEAFHFDKANGICISPAGKRLYGNGSQCAINGMMAVKFQGAKRDCIAWELRHHCLRMPDKIKTRQVAFFCGKAASDQPALLARMRQLIDSAWGKLMIAKRFATVEPVFANLRHNKSIKRFTLRGAAKVNTQWKL